MRRYWINFKGEQSGPHSLEDLKRMGVDKTAYVWHSGLDDWVKITKVPELNEMLENMATGGQHQINLEKGSSAELGNREERLSAGLPAEEVPELPVEDVPDLPVEDVPDLPPNYVGYPGGSMGTTPRGGRYPSHYDNGGGALAAQAVAETPKCPPTNLVWAIISTICCCTPLGVVAIIFAYLTKKHYSNGNYEKAEKFSERGAWTVIAAIVMQIVATPFLYLLMLWLNTAG